jgi:hypothetical protein
MATRKKSVEQELQQYADARRAVNGEVVRERIQSAQLINLLQDYALGKSKVKMNGTRLKSIEMLLDKSVPNLASIKHEIDAKQVTFIIGTNFVAPPADE